MNITTGTAKRKKIFLPLLFVFLVMVLSSVPVFADGTIIVPYAELYTTSELTTCALDFTGYFKKNTKIISVKSSNPKVVFCQKDQEFNNGDGIPMAVFNIKKRGTAVITVKGKTGTKTKTLKTTVRVVKYKKPYEYIKFGGKRISFEYGVYEYTPAATAKNVPLKIKLKAGWKVLSVKNFGNDTKNLWKGNGKTNLSIKKGKDGYIIVLYHAKKNQTHEYWLTEP